MKGKPTNVPASVLARLNNLARERGEDFNFLLGRYIQQRLLYRLTRSAHSSSFVLKGATLFALWEGAPHRATKDLDLLGIGEPDLERLRSVFADVCMVAVSDDGVTFHPDTITTESIREDALYDGIRVHVEAALGTARTRLQIDVGFGDATVPPAEVAAIPALLDQPAPELRVYARETVVAEKLQAMVELGLANSRMKDYFDIYYLSEHFTFDGRLLTDAIAATFKRRGTAIPTGQPAGLSPAFAGEPAKATQWNAFVRRAGLKSEAPALAVVVDRVRVFALPTMQAAGAATSFDRTWTSGGPWL